MIARVVTKRDESRLALATTAVAALGLAGVVIDDLVGVRLFHPQEFGVYGAVALFIALAGVGPWLAWKNRGRTVAVSCEEGLVRAGALTIRAGEVTALHVAAAARGRSVAIARGSNVVFLEVERIDEAQRIAAALNVPATPFGELGVRPAAQWVAVLPLVAAALAVVFGPLYYAAATHGFDPMAGVSGKALFGIGGVITAWVSLALLVTRRLAPGQAVAVGRGAWDAHVGLQLGRAADAEIEAVKGEEERRARALERAEEEARNAPIRVANLGRGDEPIGAWLARLDAIPSENHAYRGDAMKKDVLWEMLGDAGAPVDARMAAARLLQRRYGEAEQALVRVVEDRDVRVRVEAALEEHDEAEEHLERLGPLFRAR
ncbi:MAG TPA: hypothetical protein VLT33_01230 [Labilithrix sp.]|nr:hypothetical protein [Labilithrix sp.]